QVLDVLFDGIVCIAINCYRSAVYDLLKLVDYTCRYIYNGYCAVLTCISIGTIAIVNQSGDTFVGLYDMLDVLFNSRIFLSFNSYWSAVYNLFELVDYTCRYIYNRFGAVF